MTEIELKVKVYRSGRRYLLKIPEELEPVIRGQKEVKIRLVPPTRHVREYLVGFVTEKGEKHIHIVCRGRECKTHATAIQRLLSFLAENKIREVNVYECTDNVCDKLVITVKPEG